MVKVWKFTQCTHLQILEYDSGLNFWQLCMLLKKLILKKRVVLNRIFSLFVPHNIHEGIKSIFAPHRGTDVKHKWVHLLMDILASKVVYWCSASDCLLRVISFPFAHQTDGSPTLFQRKMSFIKNIIINFSRSFSSLDDLRRKLKWLTIA